MTDKAIRSTGGITEDETFMTALARSRVAPDYTMGALVKQTGVRPDTLRSWERRHGFPTPVRTDTNRRLYSEQDIVAIRWLREQTKRGQGISEAISMLRSRLPVQASLPHLDQPAVLVGPAPSLPVDDLRTALGTGNLSEAQHCWDNLVITLSPDAIGFLILELHQAHGSEIPSETPFTGERAHAFLLRKAMRALDHTLPDSGSEVVCLITAADASDRLPATILASAISRAGFQVITPFPNLMSLSAVDVIHQTQPSHVVLVGTSSDQAERFIRLIPDTHVLRWHPDSGGPAATSIPRLIKDLQHDR